MIQKTDFSIFFEKLTGYQPFNWQTRLFHEWLSIGKLPHAVDIPTGLGKTSIMAIWLLARATGASIPRRLIYVVDRRAVVDQATRFAEQLRNNITSDLANALELGQNDEGLPISTLRGGFADNRAWLENPTKPAIVVGTIDMIGSRLLFEGYGVSRRMRPYHAGFLGVDALVLLDEAHLCPPFESLLRRISEHRDGIFGSAQDNPPFTPQFCVIPLSATGRDSRDGSSRIPFGLDESDAEDSIVSQRLQAKKLLGITHTESDSLVSDMADQAIVLGEGEDQLPARVIIFCNSRKQAVQVKQIIDKESKRRMKDKTSSKEWLSELLVGERRVRERAELEERLEEFGFLGSYQSLPEVPTFLVATSAGEVGVDLDADHMVCDLVAYERMVQRLGRVNRRGSNRKITKVDVFAVQPATEQKVDERRQKELKIFYQRVNALEHLPCVEDSRYDASPLAISELKQASSEIVTAATTPFTLYPELSRPLLDAWTLTSLSKHEGRPEIAPWLRGWEEDDDSQTDVVWRQYLPSINREDNAYASSAMATEYFGIVPIHVSEKLQATSIRVYEWLVRRITSLSKHNETKELNVEDKEILVIVMDHAGDYRYSASFGELRDLVTPSSKLTRSEKKQQNRTREDWKKQYLPGAILIVDARIAGLCDGLLDEKFETLPSVADNDPNWTSDVKFRIEKATKNENGEGLNVTSSIGKEWLHVRTFETHFDAAGLADRGLAVYKLPDNVTSEDSRSILSKAQTLEEHANETANRTQDFATKLELPDEEIEALRLAAELHDDGKAADRWQNAMNAPKDGRPYAKTSGGGNGRLLEGYRHEFGSLLSAESGNLPENTRDLILHLIAAHHGNARPLISFAGCEAAPPSLLESKAGEVALRFSRLQNRYGPWGLAWRESILRAADQSVSREWSQRHGV